MNNYAPLGSSHVQDLNERQWVSQKPCRNFDLTNALVDKTDVLWEKCLKLCETCIMRVRSATGIEECFIEL